MAVETYRDLTVDLSTIRETLNATHAIDEQRRALAAQLGFKNQSSTYAHPLPNLYHLFTPHEKEVWEWFLPRRYKHWQFHNYAFDTIPLEVLEEFQTAQQSQLFVSYEIRTPERAAIDPILIGIGHDGYSYLIARWGESLIPFEKIVRQYNSFLSVIQREIVKKLPLFLAAAIFGLFGVGLLVSCLTR